MDHVGLRVVDFVELEAEVEHLSQGDLDHGNRVVCRLPPFRDPGSLRCHKFIENRVVLGEEPIEAFVVLLVSNVDGGDQVHTHSCLATVVGRATDHGRFQRNRRLLVIQDQADVFSFAFLLCGFLCGGLGAA